MDTDLWKKLKIEIQDKFVENLYCDIGDETLSSNVINMLQTGKTLEEINHELLDFAGSDHDSSLSLWFFERKQELESTKVPVIDNKSPSPVFRRSPESFRSRNHRRSRRRSRSFRSSDSRSRSRSPYRKSHRSNRYERRSSSTYERYCHRSSLWPVDHRSSRHHVYKQHRLSVFDRLGSLNIPNFRNNNFSKTRCKYWPRCVKTSLQCRFFHPSRLCCDFPYCKREASVCKFIHPTDNKPQNPTKSILRIPSPCRFYPYCLNPVCPYMHILIVSPEQASFMQSPQVSFSGTQLPCNYGSDCKIEKYTFIHPKDSNYDTRLICKFDGSCGNPKCIYRHTKSSNKDSIA